MYFMSEYKMSEYKMACWNFFMQLIGPYYSKAAFTLKT